MKRIDVALVRYLLILGVVLALFAAPMPAGAVTLKEELEIGKKVDAEIMKQYRMVDDPEALKQIDEYGQKLAKGVRRPEIPYHFKIYKSDDLNAFSIPGGYVYFSDHLWYVLRRDERIGVLGHEMTHVDRRHAIDAMIKEQRRQIWLSVLLTAVNAGQLAGDVAGLAESLYTLKYSRGDEQQADEVSVDLCQKAGYNPAGILLAIRKIKRFEDDRGGAPPKILSDHPPTKERVVYLEQLLTNKGIAVPPENIGDVEMAGKVGVVTAMDQTSLTFTSSKRLENGDVVWLMGKGWDYHYENHTSVPVARVVVTSVGNGFGGSYWAMPTAKKGEVVKGASVFVVPKPERSPIGIGKLVPTSTQHQSPSQLQTKVPLQPFTRLVACQVVWNKDYSKLIDENVGYVVVTDVSNGTGYLSVARAGFSYAPLEANSTLLRLEDPNARRWVGPVVSIGKNSQAIEVRPVVPLDRNKTYDVAYPAWNKDENYARRIVGNARLTSTSGKIVLKITTLANGWSMDDLQNGFDVYEQPEHKANKP